MYERTRDSSLATIFDTRFHDKPAGGYLLHEPTHPFLYVIRCTPLDKSEATRFFDIQIDETIQSARLRVVQITDGGSKVSDLNRDWQRFQQDQGLDMPSPDDIEDFDEVVRSSFIGNPA
jgi:hypothetical protein